MPVRGTARTDAGRSGYAQGATQPGGRARRLWHGTRETASTSRTTRAGRMSVPRQPTNRYLDRPTPSSLADVIDTILDKGLVIDAYVRVSLLGIELVTVDARVVVA